LCNKAMNASLESPLILNLTEKLSDGYNLHLSASCDTNIYMQSMDDTIIIASQNDEVNMDLSNENVAIGEYKLYTNTSQQCLLHLTCGDADIINPSQTNLNLNDPKQQFDLLFIIAITVSVAVLCIAALLIFYKLFPYIRNRKKQTEDKEVPQPQASEQEDGKQTDQQTKTETETANDTNTMATEQRQMRDLMIIIKEFEDLMANDTNKFTTANPNKSSQCIKLSQTAFSQKYTMQNNHTIGSGAYGKVIKVTRNRDKQLFALKIISKQGRSEQDLKRFQDEIEILAKLRHQNVIRLANWLENEQHIYMVMTLCNGGDVFKRLLQQKTFSEKEAAHVIRKVAEGLQHCHEHAIVHRDLKPDNLMYLSSDPLSNVVIIDFGLAACCRQDANALKTPCGSVHYAAPELLSSQGYNYKVDLWSLGVIAYMLLSGFPPFFDPNRNLKRLHKLIKRGKFRFTSPHWDHISYYAKDLITHLLVVDPAERFDAKQVLTHKWICKEKLRKGGRRAAMDHIVSI